MKINQNKTEFSLSDFLFESQDLPCELTRFLIKQKTKTPICTAIISQDLKSLHFISQSIFKLDIDANFKKNKPAHSAPYQFIKARLYLTAKSTINVQILSIKLQSNQRFCLIFDDEIAKADQDENAGNESGKSDYTSIFMKLTPREKQVARMVAYGKTSVKVAEKLNIAIDTVKNHRKNIRRKLKITTRAEQIKINEWLRNTHPGNKIILIE